MARKKANYPLVEGLEITTLAAEGKAMGRWNDVVVFVPLTVPGDVVDVQIRSKRRRFMEGFVVRYVRKSPLRAEAFCAHFGVCGGCKWQNLPYEEQLRFKTEQVRDQLTRIGKIALPQIAPCLGSEQTRFYRNKLEFTFADRRWLTREEVESGTDFDAAPALGFHIPNMFDKVLDIRKCWLQPDPSNGIRMEAKRFCVENGYTFHNARSHEGLMRNMIVRTASTGEVMVIVVFGEDDRERIAALLDHLAANFPQITSLFYIVNTKFNDSVGDLDPVCYKGKDHIVEEMEGLRFKVGPKSFYQTNSAQAYELYKVAREFADLKPEDVLYDLYTGTGTIANFCAARCSRVVGVEYVPEAIADAKVNSQINGIGNTVFYAGDMKQVLSDGFVAANGRPDVIILDPPRAGVDEPVILVFWGDHYNPIDSNYDVFTSSGYASDSSADPRLHQTTLLMWSNYTDKPVDLGTIAAYDISPVMMNLYGLEQPLYFQLLNRQLQVADRANTRGTVMNLDGTTTQIPSSLQESWSQKHWLLQYDLMFGKGYALSRMGMESLSSTQTDE